MKILVLSGGMSDEREVSLRSGKAIIAGLKHNGHNVLEYDPVDGYDDLEQLKRKVDMVFPILHGKHGEDGEVQQKLEEWGFRYLGSNPKVSKLCFDKVKLKDIILKKDLSTPKWEVVNKLTYNESPLHDKSHVLKPIEGGSSIDTFIVRQPRSASVNQSVFNKYPNMLLEELINGIEITVPVLEDCALPVVEIIPPANAEFDYENKYNGSAQEFCPPQNISNKIQVQAQETAINLHMAVGARHLSRTDMIIDQSGNIFVLEINTMPGMTEQSLFPLSAHVAGLDFADLCQKFVELARAG